MHFNIWQITFINLAQEYILLHAKALPDTQVIEQGTLLHLKKYV